ncbi:MAG: hypothetical protein WCV81_01650 [Microgenomates group bacterium]|jgi:hypothetical protein
MVFFKKLFFSLIIFLCLSLVSSVYAVDNSFVTVVNPIRGNDFWDQPSQKIETAVLGQIQILNEFRLPATFLIRFDAFSSDKTINVLKNSGYEKGLFLEVTPSWTKAAGVSYRQSAVWHLAGSVFLSGYETQERNKLIDTAFEEFKKTFGFYPKSVGAWWIDSYSLEYMQTKYNIDAALIVADQYSTDNYQIWGQYFATPYYPAKKNALMPAQDVKNKISVVMMQWATRDPINGYGEGVNETTYSVQANDYIDYHKLNSDYFGKLIDLYTTQQFNQFNQLVVGLENSYSWQKYESEYRKQIEILSNRQQKGQLSILTMADFAKWYERTFPDLSPAQIIVANDPLGSSKKVVWYMNPYYRAGWFYNQNGSAFRDIRQYVEGETEPCYLSACQQINFATFSTRVLDDVTYGQKLVLDKGKINDFNVKKGTGFILNYTNEAERKRQISFLPRDISIDDKISSIDNLILQTKNTQTDSSKIKVEFTPGTTKYFQESSGTLIINILKFLLFVILGLFIPGFLIVKFLKQESVFLNIFLSICSGFVMLVLMSFAVGYLKMFWLTYIYVALSFLIFIFGKFYKEISFREINLPKIKNLLPVIIIIFFGTIFQSLIMIRSGWVYDFGIGFWGPTGHDMVWHQALVNQLINNVPPQNPILAGESLQGYHYFYDLLVADTFRLTQISILDLLYRFYPVMFSIFLGIGTVCLLNRITKNKIIVLISLYFVYFAGSFGWIVTYLRDKIFSGESVFWVNQPVSMNLNPPFAISLILMIAIILLVIVFRLRKSVWCSALLVLLIGTLVEFKVYAGVVVLGGMSVMVLTEILFRRNFEYLKIFSVAAIVSIVLFISQNKGAIGLLVWSPFWFIDSMIDSPDRVGWAKLSSARLAYFERGEWLKYVAIEVLSLSIFILGNLGLRIISFSRINLLFKKDFWQTTEYPFMLFMGFASLIIPIFLIQKGNPWNTIQFLYYLIYLIALSAGFGLYALYRKLPKIIGLVFLGIVLLLAPVNAVVSFTDTLGQIPPASLSQNELEALNFLAKQPDGVVLTYPYNDSLNSKFLTPIPLFAYTTSAYVSAFSGKQTYIEDTMQNEILQTDYNPRLVAAEDFFSSGIMPPSLEGKIRYVYLPKFFEINVDTSKQWKKIFENKEVLIYEISS